MMQLFRRKKQSYSLPKLILDMDILDNGKKSEDEVKDILNFSFESGLDCVFFQNNPEVIKRRITGIPADCKIILGLDYHKPLPGKSRSQIIKIFSDLLNLFGKKRPFMLVLYDIVANRSWDEIRNGDFYKAMLAIKRKGMISQLGVHSSNVSIMKDVMDDPDIDSIFISFNVRNTLAKELFSQINNSNKTLIAFDPFQFDLLRDDPDFQKHGFYKEDFLRFVLSHNSFNSVLSDFDNIDDVWHQISASRKEKLSDEDMKRIIESADEKLGEQFCRGCQLCWPCKVHEGFFKIDIFQCLERKSSVYDDPGVKEAYHRLEMQADECAKCGDCEKRCPFHVPIIKRLEEAHKKLSN